MRTRWFGVVAAVCGLGAVLTVMSAQGLSANINGRTIRADRIVQPASAWRRWRWGPGNLPGPPGPGGPPQSRLAYAQACAADIGVINGGNDYNCMTGDEIPITVNGVKQSSPVPGSACDKPVKLGMTQIDGQCVPYTRLVDLSPPNNPDVTVMAICRKYHGTSASSTKFNDLAMIAHNRKTGTTCFFQSPVDQATPLEGTTLPSPMSNKPAASQYWLEPNGAPNNVTYQMPGGIGCTSCHDSDPFILSPWMQQVAKLNKWDPNGKYLVDNNGLFSPVAGRPWVTAGLSAPQPFTQFSKCVAGHRIGGSTLRVIAGGPGGLHDTTNGFPDFHGFMPPGNTDSALWWPYVYNEAVFELDNCVNPASGTPAAGCNTVRAGTIH